MGRGSGGRGRVRGSRGRGGRGRGRISNHSGGRNSSHGGFLRQIPSTEYTAATAATANVNTDERVFIEDVNLKSRGKTRVRGRGKRVFVSGFMGQEQSPEL
jgi:hypothetical protein